jgi:hypothetical protein
MLHTIISEGLYDKTFVAQYCYGFDQLKEHVEAYPPEKAEEITWLPATKIKEAARLLWGSTVACFIATTIILVIAYLFSVGALLGIYRQLPIEIWSALGLSIALASSVLSLAFLYSSLLKGGMGATIGALLTYLLIFPIISGSFVRLGPSTLVYVELRRELGGQRVWISKPEFGGGNGGDLMIRLLGYNDFSCWTALGLILPFVGFSSVFLAEKEQRRWEFNKLHLTSEE